MYSNICQNTVCNFNKTTKFCHKVEKAGKNNHHHEKCFCNLESGRCIKKKNKTNQDIDRPDTIEISGLKLTDVKLRIGYLEGHGLTYLKSLQRCFPLPESSGLSYGILRDDKSFIVFTENNYFYRIKKQEGDLIIYLDNYEILIKSLKKCRLIKIK